MKVWMEKKMSYEDKVDALHIQVVKTCKSNPNFQPWHVWAGILANAASAMLHVNPFTMSDVAEDLRIVLVEYNKSVVPGYEIPEKYKQSN